MTGFSGCSLFAAVVSVVHPMSYGIATHQDPQLYTILTLRGFAKLKKMSNNEIAFEMGG